MELFSLIRMFAKIAWTQGLRRASMLALCRCPWLGIFIRTGPLFHPITPPGTAWLNLLARQPLISVIMPVHDSPWLDEAIQSVMDQHYRHFELILVDDASARTVTLAAIERAARHPQVRVLRNATALGISGATNTGLAAARGEYVAFMDHDDLIHPDALALIIRAHNEGTPADVYYTDEITMNARGLPVGLMEKCAVSRDLLLACNCVLHFCVMRKAALEAIGLLDSEYDGAQDHELMIRALERGLRFQHLPFVLYAWRLHADATSRNARLIGGQCPPGGALPKPYRAGKKAVQGYLDRNHLRGSVSDDSFPWYRIRYAVPPTPAPVAILIPYTAESGGSRLLKRLERTAYPVFTCYLLANTANRSQAERLADAHPQIQVRVVSSDDAANPAHRFNRAVEHITEECVVFMSPELEPEGREWLDALVEQIHRPDVGAAGGYLSGTHDGTGWITHPATGVRVVALENNFYLRVQREVSVLRQDGLITRRSVFQRLGGFDALAFPCDLFAADYCLKLKQAGLNIMYTPFARLAHHGVMHTAFDTSERTEFCRRHIGRTELADRYHASWCVD